MSLYGKNIRRHNVLYLYILNNFKQYAICNIRCSIKRKDVIKYNIAENDLTFYFTKFKLMIVLKYYYSDY